MPAQLSYSTSKAGLLGLTKTIAAENATHGVTANAVQPGMTATSEMLSANEAVLDVWRASIPTGELIAEEYIDDLGLASAPTGL